MSMELVKADQSPEQQQVKIPDMLPVLPLPDTVVFPYMIVPLFVNRDRSAKAVDQALSENRMVLLVPQKNAEVDDPKPEDLYNFGTVSVIMRMLKLPDGRIRILVQGFSRAKVEYFDESKPYITAKVEPKTEPQVVPDSPELEAIIRNVKSSLEKMVSLGKNISSDLVAIATNLDDPGRLSDLVASNLDLKVDKAQEVLEVLDPVERLRRVHQFMAKEIEVLEIQNDINTQARGEMDKSQREFYLRQQMKAIQQELGEGNELQEEVEQYREKIKKAKMPQEVAEEAERQLGRLERMHPDAAETATLRNYLDWLVGLPWSKATKDNLDLKKAQRILDEDHYGLEKIKDRIIEHLAVRKLKKDSKGPILCFVGPPGVGKTSLGKSIARALGRKFVRMSLGGVHDEAEIRGHRRTYIGALPGQIMQGIRRAETNDPVFMLDEIDKVGPDFRGDPGSALLEALDPEQNFSFRDNYLDVPFDLSKVLFITTANMLDPVAEPLRDRMEIIELQGYTEEEKVHIAFQYLIPRQIEENGINGDQIEFPEETIRFIIRHYTREAGVRNLERTIGTICRKQARRLAEGKTEKLVVTPEIVQEFLGGIKIRTEGEIAERTKRAGVAVGLAWTPTGGDILFVEANTMKGKGGFTMTGQLGQVMQESMQAALTWVRSNAKDLGIDEGFFADHDIHIHVPAGAIPKDGPSAGVTMVTALVSLLTDRPVRPLTAMTGEITLSGNVLPIGGIKEKTLAAKRAGVTDIILPAENRQNVEEDLTAEQLQGLNMHYVKTIEELLSIALPSSHDEVKQDEE